MFRQTLLLSAVLILLIACKSEPELVDSTVVPTQEAAETAVSQSTTTPQPTNRQISLGGFILEQVEPGIIDPDRALWIDFNQPLQADSTTHPLQFEPPVAGEFSWNDEGTRLTFIPKHGFATSQSYQITQSPDLLPQSGEPFPEQLVWQIKTLSALSMASANTSQQGKQIADDEALLTFSINFERVVDWQDVEEEISVEPAVPMKVSWWENGRYHQKEFPDDEGRTVDEPFTEFPQEKQMLVQLRVPIDLEQTYHFQLQEWVTGCSCNRVLHDAFSAEVTLPPIRAKVEHTNITPQFRFNYRLDLENLLSAIVLFPEFETEWHAEWDGYETVLTMDPNNLLPNKILYDFGFTESVYHENGTLLTPPNRMASFPTPFSIVDEYPGREDWIAFNPLTNIEITFTHKMDEQSVIDAFQIEPDVPGTFVWKENRFSFQPEAGHLDAWSQYTITLGTEMRDSLGRPILPEPYSWRFATSELPTDADFGRGTKVQMVAVDGERAVQYRSYPQEPTEVTFALYALQQDDVLQFLRDEQLNHDILVEAARWTAVTEPNNLDDYRRESLQETFIPSDVPAGPYLLTLAAGTSQDELLVLISENSVVAKTAEAQLLVWTTKINGEIAGGLDISVVDENGEIVANGRSSNEGIFQTEIAEEVHPAFVFVQDGNDFAVTGLARDWFTFVHQSGYYSSQLQRPADTIIYLHTDRPLYRPDETVYFKGILRQDEDVQLRPFPEESLVTVQLKSPDDELLDSLELVTNDFGTVHGQFRLSETAVSGDYRIVMITAEGYETSQIFKVDALPPSTYSISVATDADSYVEDDTVSITVESRTLTDEPMVDADVKIRLFSLDGDRWDDDVYYSDWITGTTDINGRFTAEIGLHHNPWTVEAFVEASVGHEGQLVSGIKRIQVHDDPESIQLDIGGYYQELGVPITGTVTIQNYLGEPVIGRDITLELRNNNGSNTPELAAGQSDENGRYIFTFTPAELGYYYVRASIVTSLGYLSTESTRFVVLRDGKTEHENELFNYSGDAQLQFVHTGEVYKIGEPIKLYVQSRVAGPAFLTLERGGVYAQEIVHLTPPLTVIDVPVAENGAPNLFATIMAWKAYEPPEYSRGAINVPEYQLLAAELNIPVATDPYLLNVELLSVDTLGDETEVTLRVTDHQGLPVAAELSIAVVDEAIDDLSPDFTYPMLDTFYFQRKNQARNFDAMNSERYLWYDVRDIFTKEFSGMSYYGLFENYRNWTYSERPPLNTPYGEFAETAVWLPTLRTDENGEVTVSFTLPEEQANWQIQVKAITIDSQVGEAVFWLIQD